MIRSKNTKRDQVARVDSIWTSRATYDYTNRDTFLWFRSLNSSSLDYFSRQGALRVRERRMRARQTEKDGRGLLRSRRSRGLGGGGGVRGAYGSHALLVLIPLPRAQGHEVVSSRRYLLIFSWRAFFGRKLPKSCG